MADHDSDYSAEDHQKLWGMIKDIRFAMLTTRHADGELRSHPMTTQNSSVDDRGTLWFFMSRHGEPALDLASDPIVNVAYADTGDDCYVSVSGSASVVEDAAKKHALWSKLAAAWFPQGPDDPDLALVAVRISRADYWDVKESKMVQLWAMAKAAMTGRPPVNLGERGSVRMS
ncbi:MAG: pyridoxamine 5'-phosphate oxidase family protein [Proteobacteria bacterium]|nr:pyridoxamine 5'-phosphate oxidase family protein [Pseudomonadota bacterium]